MTAEEESKIVTDRLRTDKHNYPLEILSKIEICQEDFYREQ